MVKYVFRKTFEYPMMLDEFLQSVIWNMLFPSISEQLCEINLTPNPDLKQPDATNEVRMDWPLSVAEKQSRAFELYQREAGMEFLGVVVVLT